MRCSAAPAQSAAISRSCKSFAFSAFFSYLPRGVKGSKVMRACHVAPRAIRKGMLLALDRLARRAAHGLVHEVLGLLVDGTDKEDLPVAAHGVEGLLEA